MPALSSPIDAAVGHLVALARDAADDPPGLLAMLAGVADPRVDHLGTLIPGCLSSARR